MRSTKNIKKTYAVLVYGHVNLHHMVIFKSQNKITDLLMILDLGMSL